MAERRRPRTGRGRRYRVRARAKDSGRCSTGADASLRAFVRALARQAARECFWQAYRAQRPAEFVSTRPTTEGDPITTIYRVLGAGRVEIFIDSTQDRFSAGGWQRLDCTRLTLGQSLAPAPDFGPDNTCVETPLH